MTAERPHRPSRPFTPGTWPYPLTNAARERRRHLFADLPESYRWHVLRLHRGDAGRAIECDLCASVALALWRDMPGGAA